LGQHVHLAQPPLSLIGAEAERNVSFALALGDMLPRMAFTLYRSQHWVKGITHQSGSGNTGYLPTYTSEQGKKRKAIRPVRAEIELPEVASLVNGRRG